MRTLGDRTDDSAVVMASRMRRAVKMLRRIVRNQRDRELAELGYRDVGGEAG